MSNVPDQSLPGTQARSDRDAEIVGQHRPFDLAGTLRAPLEAVAFWSAVSLPAVYLPFLALGIDSIGGLALFLGLFALHLLTLVVGRSYRSA